ncbi:hypothetical protein BGZ96_001422 [Linnemannia gamsii]|uniref:BTB domain-containing protein n=1 Tax=Linnemannia gamsii TaxID=64522 RepID=A0ABQ7JMB1_9FUNG|nr:hypothetical protein BGZ96_001422 [Linnemannia gamsii]
MSPQIDRNSSTPTIKTQNLAGNSFWTIILTRSHDDKLTLHLKWCRVSHADQTYYNSMHVFPHSSPNAVFHYSFASNCVNPVNGTEINCGSFPAEKVTNGNKYEFDIVLCTVADIPRVPILPTPPVPKNHDIIPLLLKDVNSVDVCFNFTCDKAYSNVGLWAHRVVLTRYKFFSKLLQLHDELQQSLAVSANIENDPKKSSKAESDAESTCTESVDGSPISSPTTGTETVGDLRSLVVKVDKFSLATFCALLYYIYTNEVHLTIDTDRFVVSSGEGSLVWRDAATGKMRDSMSWHPMDRSSPWRLKDVTWEELLEAADHYGISDLRTNCLGKVISGMNQSNVVGTLFSKAASGPEVRQAAMEYIVKHWDSIFQKGENRVDHFAAYRAYPDCHEVLIELIHMKSA